VGKVVASSAAEVMAKDESIWHAYLGY
jgi:hypothetical protein